MGKMGELKSYNFWLNTLLGKVKDFSYKEYLFAFANLLKEKIKLYIKTASGAVASFSDGADDVPIVSLNVAVEPVQDLHGYDSPWPGGGGKNLLNVGSRVSQTTAGVNYTSDENYVYLNGTKNGQGYATLSTLTLDLTAGTYYVRAFQISGTSTVGISVYVNNGSADVGGNILQSTAREFSFESDTRIRFRVLISTDGTVFNDFALGIVVSKTNDFTAWTPYENICPISGWTAAMVTVNGTTITHEFTDELGNTLTVYGGEDELIGGKLRVTMAEVDLGTLNWTTAPSGRHNCTTAQIGNIKIVSNTKTMNSICSQYKVTNGNGVINNDMSYGMLNSSSIQINDSRLNGITAEEFKAAMDGVQLVYELATPLEYDLTREDIRTLYGDNTIFADCGDVEVTYYGTTPP